MRLAVPTALGQTYGGLREPGAPSRFGVPQVLTIVLMVVALPVFVAGAVVALPVGAAVLGVESLRRAWAARTAR